MAAAIRSTQAIWMPGDLSRDRNGFLQRGKGYGQLRQRWEATPQRLLVFHHYDSRGLLPQSWREALVSLQAAGWQVVLSFAICRFSRKRGWSLPGLRLWAGTTSASV